MRVEENVPLAGLTTMRVGGPARRLVTVETTDELVDAVREVDEAGESLFVLSGGSNLVVADAGFPGTVVRVATRGIERESVDACSGATLRIAAGEVWDEVVALAIDEGWAGVEALSGIPGCVGSTPVQNVGAYGQEVAQTIARVRTWDRAQSRARTFTAAECGFRYRDSIFKATRMPGMLGADGPVSGASPRYVVLDVTFQLELADLSRPIAYADLARGLGVELGQRVPLADAREAVLEQRRRRGMVLDLPDHDTWSCGSFFTNPVLDPQAWTRLAERVTARLGDGVVPPRFDAPDEGPGHVKTSAAWLIDRAGYGKGYRLPGPAALSAKHPLAVTNRGFATAADIVALAREVRDGVRDAFGVTLVNEPVLVGLEL